VGEVMQPTRYTRTQTEPTFKAVYNSRLRWKAGGFGAICFGGQTTGLAQNRSRCAEVKVPVLN
jgi:hypothetical protein